MSVYKTVDQENLNGRAEDTAYLSDVESSEVPTLEEVEAILQMGIEQVRDTRVGRLLDVYDEMLSQADADCPRWFTNPDGLYWADTCTSEEGVSFQGFATSYPGMIRCLMTMEICLRVVRFTAKVC